MKNIKKILIIFGTRPEAIKLSSIILELKKQDSIKFKICITAQHRSMLDSVLQTFDIHADYDLNIMQDSKDLFSINANALLGLKGVIEDFNPSLIFVHGDTNTTFMGALSAFYFKIPICHIEAGLRTNDIYNPFPEEMNRQITTKLSTYHFAPTKLARDNLLKDGVKKSNIKIVGNTVIDALKFMQKKIKNNPSLESKIIKNINLTFLDSFVDDKINNKVKFILVTIHRRESFGKDVENIALALKQIALSLKETQIVYPLHLNPNIQEPMNEILGNIKNIHLIKPLDYESFVYLMINCYLILTDSGGIQEEATILHKPTLILRNTTERKEALDCKTLKLVGTNRNKIIKETLKLFDYPLPSAYLKMSNKNNSLPYGNGKSAKKIISFLKKI